MVARETTESEAARNTLKCIDTDSMQYMTQLGHFGIFEMR